MSRVLYRSIGILALGLAALGAILPVLPTTVFVLLAAWAFARSSPKLHASLRAHKRFGPALRDWEDHGAIPTSAKAAAVGGMVISLAVVVALSTHWAPPVLTGLIMLASGAFVLTRPTPPAAARKPPTDDG